MTENYTVKISLSRWQIVISTLKALSGIMQCTQYIKYNYTHTAIHSEELATTLEKYI